MYGIEEKFEDYESDEAWMQEMDQMDQLDESSANSESLPNDSHEVDVEVCNDKIF